MRRALILVGLAGSVMMAAPATGGLTPVQVPMVSPNGSSALNRDVIVNFTAADGVDTTQYSADGTGWAYITKTATEEMCSTDPDGLPDRGRFAGNGDHPFVDLPYENSSNGRNALVPDYNDPVKIAVPRHKYETMHIFATSGSGDSALDIKFNYKNGTQSSGQAIVWDWFDDSPDTGYFLVENNDRAKTDASKCDDANGANIYGFPLGTKPGRVLKNVVLKRIDDDASVLVVFGMTGHRAS